MIYLFRKEASLRCLVFREPFPAQSAKPDGERTPLLTSNNLTIEESEIKEALGRPLIDHLRRLMGCNSPSSSQSVLRPEA